MNVNFNFSILWMSIEILMWWREKLRAVINLRIFLQILVIKMKARKKMWSEQNGILSFLEG